MRTPVPPAPAPPPAPTPRWLLQGLRHVRPGPPQRWAFALRAALAMGIPILVGHALGDLQAGLMATIGAFTALYCGDRPYASRAIALASIAGAFALAVGFGLWLEQWPWLIVPALSLVAMLATWLCSAMRIGPPGAYMFMLACAAGTALPAEHLSPWQAGLLVLGGGVVAWLLHTVGGVLQLRGPERKSVAAAGRAVAACIASGPADPAARRIAAQSLHESWQMLVGFQPIPARSGGELQRLRALNRELHLLFAGTLDAPSTDHAREAALARAHALTAQALRPAIRRPPSLPANAIPHGYPRSWRRLREGLAPGSNALRLVLRVGLATLATGALAAAMDMERAYWAMAAALLVLHQGLDWPRTAQRGLERTLGTWIGLLLAGAILWWHPSGIALALVVMALQFIIELTVVRHYAFAAVFITGAALTIAAGGQPVDDIAGLLLARGLDTLLGCACALLAFRLLPPRADARTLSQAMARCLLAIRQTCLALAGGDVTSPGARTIRRDLQHCSFVLEQRMDEALAGSRDSREAAQQWWPGVSICQRLAYRVLAACWDSERHPGDATAGEDAAQRLRPQDAAPVATALGHLASACQDHVAPPPLPPLPALVRSDIDDLRVFLEKRLS